ncbi:O-antigen ligase family protein, partial [Leisingera sp. JC1]|uniref:O-antigen ligase family protein n=1 Tax=Leisingera sp. JC1 TaxID=1855282 RepID=UPI000802AB42
MTSLIAFRLGLTLSADRALFILAGIFAAAILLSLANTAVGFLPPAWEHNGALLGIFTQKNMMGKAAVLGLLTVICVLKHKRVPVAGICVYLAGFFLVKSTLSAGALLTYLCAGLLFPLFAMRKFTVRGRLIFLLLPVVFVVLYLAAFVLTGGDPLAVFLEATGKSPTLTGRTIIWWFGIQSFLEHPLLGVGFKAYWSVKSYAIAYIHANIEEGLYWFHNIYIDILVAGGLLGAAAAAALLYCFVRQALRWYLYEGSVVSAAWGMILLVSLIGGLADNVMFTLHGLNHMLIIMGFIFGHRALSSKQERSGTA